MVEIVAKSIDTTMENDSNPLVSVIIPTYNRPKMLEVTLQSVLNQTFKDYEILIIDSSEGNETKDLIDKVNYSRLLYFKIPKKKGVREVSRARNKGIIEAHGQFIAFLDDDDIWLPTKLEEQVELMLRSPKKVGLIYCGFIISSYPDGKCIKIDVPKYRGEVSQQIMQRGFILTVTVLVRKECFNIAGLFDESLEAAEDWDMWVRIGKIYHFDYIEEPLATYNVNVNRPDSYCDELGGLKAWQKVFQKHMNDMNDETLGYDYHRMAVSYLKLGMKKEANKNSQKAISTDMRWNYIAVLLLIPFGSRFFKLICKISGR